MRFSMKSAVKPQREHDERGDDEQDLAFARGQDVAGDVLNPAVGAELDRADQQVRDEQHEQQERAEREVRQHAHADEQRASDDVRPHGRACRGRR